MHSASEHATASNLCSDPPPNTFSDSFFLLIRTPFIRIGTLQEPRAFFEREALAARAADTGARQDICLQKRRLSAH